MRTVLVALMVLVAIVVVGVGVVLTGAAIRGGERGLKGGGGAGWRRQQDTAGWRLEGEAGGAGVSLACRS